MKKIIYKPRIQVLYVEDDKNVAKKYIEELIQNNIFVHHVDNLQDAKDALKKCEMDIVLSDGAYPPKKNGVSTRGMFIKLANYIKENKIKTKTIALSNSTGVLEFCKKNRIEAYSKEILTREWWAGRGKKYINIQRILPKELADKIEVFFIKKIGFDKMTKSAKLEKYYSEPATVLVIFLAFDMRTALFYKTAGKNYGPAIFEIQDGLFTCYIDPKNDKAIAQSIFKKFFNGYFPKVKRSVYKKANDLLKVDKKLCETNYSKCSNEKLLTLYLEFCDRLIDMRLYSSLPTALEHGTNLWTDYLHKLLKKKIKDQNEFNRVFSVLTTPDKNSYIKDFELDLAKCGIKKFSKKSIRGDVKKIIQKYAWINYTSEGIPIDATYVEKKIAELGKKSDDFQAIIDKRELELKQLARNKKEIYKKYKFSKRDKEVFEIGAEMVFIKFFRKGIFAESYYSAEFLLIEIAKRIKCNKRYPFFMFPNEVLAALKMGSFPEKIIPIRIKDSLLYGSSGASYPLSANAKKYYQKEVEIESGSKIIKGQVAVVGKVFGIVKLVNIPSDMTKFKSGDILVSRSTNPTLVPAMRMASAIITDTGGLTCHAAIIARELKKPCIVGTKNSTSLLKDGDKIEVDAYTGTITRL